MRRSIRSQLLVPLGVLILGTFGVSGWSAVATARRAGRDVEARVAGVAQTLNGAHFPLTPAVLEQMKGLTGAELILDAGPGRITSTLDISPLDVPQTHADAESWQGRITRVGTRNYLYESIRLRPGHPNAGGTLFVLYPKDRFDAEVAEAVRPPLTLGFAGGAGAVGMMILVGQRLVRRLRELDRQTRRIAGGDFAPMPLPDRGDELRDLGQAVNDMAGRLQLLHDRMQQSERMRLLGQVSGGLAHQLRNAVAGAKLAVQLHARSCSGGDAEALDVARRQLTRVEVDLARFLDLGRERDADRRPERIADLVAEAVALLRPQCRHTGIDLLYNSTETDVLVAGDSGQLGHVFVNLLANAAEAAGPGGRVEAAIRRPAAEVCIVEISDTGPGPAAEVAGQMFEPFVTGKADGIGLGLFVARQVVEAHGGRLDWRREPSATVFRVELPALPDRKAVAASGDPQGLPCGA
jgi:signal transduction histidine kinase